MTSRTRYLILAIAAASLVGCAAIPTSLQLASLAGSGISFVTTGKTLSDHALSSVTQRDCRMFRIVNGQQICSRGAEIPSAAIEERSLRTAAKAARFAVIGSFESKKNAQAWRLRHHKFVPHIVTIKRAEKMLYRVTVGPLKDATDPTLFDQFRLAGIDQAWTMTHCAQSLESVCDTNIHESL